MKTTCTLIFIVFLGSHLFGQTFLDKSEGQIIGEENLNPKILADLGLITSNYSRNAEITGNSVFLTQIGEMNNAMITTNTTSSEIVLIQNGNSNLTNIDYYTNTAVAELVQNGDFNKIKDHVSNPAMDISLELTQEGDHLNFVREGVNELTKSLKFIQTEASPSLIIRSYQ